MKENNLILKSETKFSVKLNQKHHVNLERHRAESRLTKKYKYYVERNEETRYF